MHNIPTPEGPTHLAVLNLMRSWRMGLPAGSAVGAYMGVTNAMTPATSVDDCLWVYILKEAEMAGNAPGGQGGIELGSVGSRIVAEVFAGLLLGDPASYMSLQPEWTPARDLPSLFADVTGPVLGDNNWSVSDIVKISGAPIDDPHVKLLAQATGLSDTGVLELP